MNPKTITTVSIAALLLAALPSARAAVTTTASSTAPDAATTIASYDIDTNPNGYALRWDGSAQVHRDISQSFYVASAATLESFTLQEVHNQTTTSALINLPFTVSIYEVPSATALPTDPDATLVSTQTGAWTIPGVTAASTYITFNLDQGVPLEAGNYYTFVLSLDSGANNATFIAATNIGDDYANGVASSLTYTWVSNTTAGAPGSWTVVNPGGGKSADYIFYANGVAAIPEPAATTALLGALALGTAILIQRKRKRN